METKKVARMGILIALALVFSYVESLIPVFVAIPGIKVGLANIVVVVALYILSAKDAAIISLLRVVLSGLLFGSVLSMAYSAAGAALSLLGMVLLKKTDRFSVVAASVAGGVLHNVGQIIIACLILETDVVLYYLPFLVISGTLAGIVIGFASGEVVKRIGNIIEE